MPINTLFAFGNAVAELTLRLGGRNDSSGGIPFSTRATQWLNSAQYLIAKCPIALPDLDTATATLNLIPLQGEYLRNSTTPPLTDMIGIYGVQIIDTYASPFLKVQARRFPFREYRALSMQAGGMPTRWTRRGDRIAFDGIPDRAGYQALFDYRRMPQQDVVNIDAAYQELWIKTAKWLAWSSLDQPDKARLALGELPQTFQAWFQTPLDEDQWEAAWDPDLVIAPASWERGWSYTT